MLNTRLDDSLRRCCLSKHIARVAPGHGRFFFKGVYIKLKIEPSDFYSTFGHAISEQRIAQLANAKLDEWLKSATVVYGSPETRRATGWHEQMNGTSHRALLINIEELPKKPCKHIPDKDILDFAIDGTLAAESRCRHCGVKLVAEWREAAE